jgi:hypothetical protein
MDGISEYGPRLLCKTESYIHPSKALFNAVDLQVNHTTDTITRSEHINQLKMFQSTKNGNTTKDTGPPNLSVLTTAPI